MKVALFNMYDTESAIPQGHWAGLRTCNRVDIGRWGEGKEEVVKVWWVNTSTLVVAQSSSFLIQ